MKIITLLVWYFAGLIGTLQADPLQISLHNALKMSGVEHGLSLVLPGDKSFAEITYAAIILDGSEKIPGLVGFQFHIRGSKYLIPYNFEVNTHISFNIEQNCKITHLDIQSDTNFGYGYDTAFFHVSWYFLEKSLEEQVIRTITEEISSINDPQLKMLCGYGF